MKQGLIDRGFYYLEIDLCLFTHGQIIIIVYMDNIIIATKDSDKIKKLLALLKKGVNVDSS